MQPSFWIKTAALVAAGYAGVVGLGRLGYRSLLYPAPRRGVSSAPRGATLEQFVAGDGTAVQALLFLPPNSRVVVYFHGNGETVADSAWLGEALRGRGVGFVAVEYRGYGSSPAAQPCERGLYDDGEAVLRGLEQKGVEREQITLWGSSLGSGVAVEMAVRGYGSKLVLSSPFTSIPDVAQRLLPLLPMWLVIGDRFDNLAKAPHVTIPTLVLHGDADRVVPYDLGVTLTRAIEGASLITVPGGGHNDLFARDRAHLLDEVVRVARR